MKRILVMALMVALAAVFAGTLGLARPAMAASLLIVDDDKAQCAAADFSSIQAAVDAASDGDTIRVCSGTYAEHVNVNKSLTLEGARAGIDARDPSRTGLAATESVVTGTGNNGITPFFVSTDGVTIDGFTVEGNTSSIQFGAGLRLGPRTSGTEVSNNIVQSNVVGLYLANESTTDQTVIRQNLFRNNNQPGVATGTAIYSDQFTAGGALTNVLIEDNGFTGHDRTAVVLGSTQAGSQSDITISENEMSGNGNGVGATNMISSSITRNTFTGSSDSQILLTGGVKGLEITQNFVEDGNTRGIRIANFTGTANDNITIDCNSIEGNAGSGLDVASGSYSGATLDARYNWWGSPTGPRSPGNPGGTGQAIVDPGGKVDFTPFLFHGADVDSTTPGFQCLPRISVSDVTAIEGNHGTTAFDFAVKLNTPSPAAGVTFDIATADDTATVSDSDYTPLSLTGQTIVHGETNYTASVRVTGDTKFEANETFFLNVTNVTGAMIDDGQGVGTIRSDDPSADDDTYSADEDTALTVNAPGVLGNDLDPDSSEPLKAEKISGPSHGTLDLSEDGSFTYVPEPNFNGDDSFTYKATTGVGGEDTATATIKVKALNDEPIAHADSISVNEDMPLGFSASDLLINDEKGAAYEDDQTLSVTKVGGATHGTVSLQSGAIIFMPEPDYNGTEASFVYEVCDDGKTGEVLDPMCDVSKVNIEVLPVNDAPVANAISVNTNEEEAATIDALLSASDIDGDALSISNLSAPSHGSAEVVGGKVLYTPTNDYSGEDSFTYAVSDGKGGTDTATISITVEAVNDAPKATDDPYSVDEDQTLRVPDGSSDLLANDSDVDGDLLAAVVVQSPAHGQLALSPDGSFTYTSEDNYYGADAFTYKASDGNLESDVATVNITVNPINDEPVGTTDRGETQENTPLVLTQAELIRNDDAGAPNEDTQNLTIKEVSDPKHGTVTLNEQTAEITFTPDAGYNGTEASFLYTLCDDGEPQPECSVEKVTVSVTITEVNDPPVASADEISLSEDGEQVFDLLSNDSTGPANEATQTLKVDSVATQPTHGAATLITSGTDAGKVNYKPDADYYGSDSFTYKVCDDGTTNGEADAKCDVGAVSVTVSPLNSRPQVKAASFTMDEDAAPLTIDFSELVSDAETSDSNLTYNIGSVKPNQGTLSGTAQRRTFDSADDFNGTLTISYTVTDRGDPDNCSAATQGGSGACAAARTSEQKKVSITVAPVNDAPVANNDRYRVKDKGLYVPLSGVLKNDSDVDGDTLSATMVSKPSHGRLVLREDGTFAYRPEKNYTGRDSFTYLVSDGAGGKDTATVRLRVL